MPLCPRLLLVLLLLSFSLVFPAYAGVPVGGVIQLEADFDDRLPGEALGAGGPLLGEPTDLSALDGTIVETSPGENVLRVTNNTGSTSGRSLRWEFLDSSEITTGNVRVEFSITPSALDRYSFGIRESGGSSRLFLAVNFSPSGTLSASDAAGVIALTNATYAAGNELAVVIEFDMDARTSQMTINGLPLFSGRSHGITDRGVGRLLTGYASGHTATPFDLDNLQVVADGPLPLVLDADLEDQPLGQPIGTGGAALGQPVSFSSGLLTEVVQDGMSNRALRVEFPSTGAARTMRWEFLDNLEIDTGVVAFDVDLEFEVRDGYQITVRENGSSSSSFTNLRFFPSGTIGVSDANGTAPVAFTSYVADQRYRVRLIFDMDQGTYSIFLDDSAVLTDRAHGVSTGRGVGAISLGFLSSALAGSALIMDDLQVGAADAPVLPSQLTFLVEPGSGVINQPLTPALEVGVVTVFDQNVPDGTLVEVGIESGPAGGVITGTLEPTVDGVARFDSLQANLPGTYRLRARSARAVQSSLVDIIVLTPADPIFADRFE